MYWEKSKVCKWRMAQWKNKQTRHSSEWKSLGETWLQRNEGIYGEGAAEQKLKHSSTETRHLQEHRTNLLLKKRKAQEVHTIHKRKETAVLIDQKVFLHWYDQPLYLFYSTLVKIGMSRTKLHSAKTHFISR